jgi:glycine/D-amino acid oxidase-like deaminating enzyme
VTVTIMGDAIRETPYWSATVEPHRLTERAWPTQVDVAVIGGGYTGLSTARELARRGAAVAVFEAHTFGWGASSRNGGMVLTGLKAGVGKLVKRYGLQTARDLFRTSLDAIGYTERLVCDEGIACGFARCGHVELAYKPSHYEAYTHEAELLQRDFGHAVRLVPKAELHTEIGSDAYHGGLVDAVSAGLNPAKYATGLAAAADHAGAMLFDQIQVTHISREAGGFRVTTSHGIVNAREVVVATNGYTGKLTPFLRKRVIPIGSYIIATEPLPTGLAHELIPHGRMLFDSKNFLYYFRLSADNRVIFGGRAAFSPETPNTVRESAEILRRGMIGVYPQLADAKIEYAWGGTLGFTFDLLPHAGRADDGAHYALGCGGHGVALLTYLGACLAQQLSGETVSNPLFALPFPTAPLGLYDGNPWFLPFAGLYYRFLDRVG